MYQHKSSHHPTKKIIGNPVKEFVIFFNDLFYNAKKWTDICFYKKSQLRDPERKRVDDFIISLRTKIPTVRKKINALTKEDYIASHAGVQSLENYLESFEKLINTICVVVCSVGQEDSDFRGFRCLQPVSLQ